MQPRPLGNTGPQVTVIGFGAMTIGGAFGPVDDAESTAALHAAIDTTNAYGEGRGEGRQVRYEHSCGHCPPPQEAE